MKKDVIYIDIEDDITTIIDKVKEAATSIVALVPPKRIGVLQSIVNLKLLQRAADTAGKRIVLITSDHALVGLAAGLAIPVAKNLQSKPEVATIDSDDNEDDSVIDGADLPLGAGVAGVSATDPATLSTIEADTTTDSAKSSAVVGAAALRATKKTGKKGLVRIPDFDTFRKRLFIFGGLGVLLIGFLIWALLFAGQATVAITAQTNIVNISKTLQLQPNATLDAKQGVMAPVVKQLKKTDSVDFEATGKKEVGEKATGTVKLSTDSITMLGKSVPAGTELTASNGLVYITNSAVMFTLSNATTGANVGVTAVSSGSKFNGATGGVDGLPNGIDGSFVTASAGGTDKTVTVVSADDIAKAKEKLSKQDSKAAKEELKKQFGADDVVIDMSFSAETAEPTATPALDQEATAAKLSAESTYTLVGVKRADLKATYDEYLATQIDQQANQKVYESGEKDTEFIAFEKADGGYTAKLTAVAQVGPNIKTDDVANSIKTMRTGEVQQYISAIQGVEDVKVTLEPFWVNRVPDDVKRIKITFTLKQSDD